MRKKVKALLAGVVVMLAAVFVGPQAQAALVQDGYSWMGHQKCGVVSSTKYIQDSQVQRQVTTYNPPSGTLQMVRVNKVAFASSGYGYVTQLTVAILEDSTQIDQESFNLYATSGTVTTPSDMFWGESSAHSIYAKVYTRTTTGNSCTTTVRLA